MVICTRNPCALWICDLWFCEFLVHANYSPTNLESNTPCCVWPAYSLVWPSISFYNSSSLWDFSWIPLLLGELRPILGPTSKGLKTHKAKRMVGGCKKKKKNSNGNYIYQTLLGFLMIKEARSIQFWIMANFIPA